MLYTIGREIVYDKSLREKKEKNESVMKQKGGYAFVVLAAAKEEAQRLTTDYDYRQRLGLPAGLYSVYLMEGSIEDIEDIPHTGSPDNLYSVLKVARPIVRKEWSPLTGENMAKIEHNIGAYSKQIDLSKHVPAIPMTFVFAIAPGEYIEPTLMVNMDDVFIHFGLTELGNLIRGTMGAGAPCVIGMQVPGDKVTAEQIMRCLKIARCDNCPSENIFSVINSLTIEVPEEYELQYLQHGELCNIVTFRKIGE